MGKTRGQVKGGFCRPTYKRTVTEGKQFAQSLAVTL